MARHFANWLDFELDAWNQRVGGSNWFKSEKVNAEVTFRPP